MDLIKLKNITKIYHPSKAVSFAALKNINLHIKKGEFVAIMGPSGSGKSTLMYIIGLLDRPTLGKYFLQGQEITSHSSDANLSNLRSAKIGFVFQTFNLLPRTSVLDNVMLPLIYGSTKFIPSEVEGLTTGSGKKDRKKRVLSILEKVGLSKKLNSRPSELSGGEQQRVAIARALVNQPEIILADEPTGNLDSKTGQQIVQILKNLNTEGTTVILVTHEKEIASQADRIVELKDGEIV